MSDQTHVMEWTGGTTFKRRGDRYWVSRLCGMMLGRDGVDAGPTATQGVALLTVDGCRYEADQLTLEHVDESATGVACRWRVGATPLRLTTVWTHDPETGIVSRRDTVSHSGGTAVVLSRCLARVAFPCGRYEGYSQMSRWCYENQGEWHPLHTGLRQSHLSGRTTEGGTPYLAVRPEGGDRGIVFHILPCGNWTLRMSPVADGGELPFAVVELGLNDENLHRSVLPGETLELPEILFQPLPQGAVHLAAPNLHRYLLSHSFKDAKPEAPVVYNTWFDQFEILDVPRLREQLAVAKEIGCEVFVIDAGWYGAGGPDWGAQTGDWREKTEAAFCGGMRAFADEVRAVGLGFGLWMEPERFGAQAPIRDEHPEWFIRVGDNARIDLVQHAAYAWVRAEIGRLVETYGLAWMKIDFNLRPDMDASGSELGGYTAAWYRLLDDVCRAYPDTFFEGCSSGAMRGDLEMMRYVDGHFLSDTVNPTDVLRITQGAWLRLPPGRIGRWTVVRAVEQAVPEYRKTLADSPAIIVVPAGGVWNPTESVGLVFALLTAMPGMMGLSGDLVSLTPEHRAQVVAAIAFFKNWRRFITGAVGHLLTPPLPITCRSGWIAFQLQCPAGDTSLVFVYRLGAAGCVPPLRLRGLDVQRRYGLRWGFQETLVGDRDDGARLMDDGLSLPPAIWNDRAAVCVVRAEADE